MGGLSMVCLLYTYMYKENDTCRNLNNQSLSIAAITKAEVMDIAVMFTKVRGCDQVLQV